MLTTYNLIQVYILQNPRNFQVQIKETLKSVLSHYLLLLWFTFLEFKMHTEIYVTIFICIRLSLSPFLKSTTITRWHEH
jgi:hypothetical protein